MTKTIVQSRHKVNAYAHVLMYAANCRKETLTLLTRPTKKHYRQAHRLYTCRDCNGKAEQRNGLCVMCQYDTSCQDALERLYELNEQLIASTGLE